jgi:hypothetical protein
MQRETVTIPDAEITKHIFVLSVSTLKMTRTTKVAGTT